ncbi:TPA: hypothetical protein QEK91_004091 [Stenotrophomonas maltophilia]|nr:hypothetical protein [Stenotrophomonas maltophilia]
MKRALLPLLAAVLAAVLAACSTPAGPTEADVLEALQKAYSAALDVPAVETNSDGQQVARFQGHDEATEAVTGFPAAPLAVSLIACHPHPAMGHAWICEAGVSFPSSQKTWGTWVIHHTPRAGWNAAHQPEQHQ